MVTHQSSRLARVLGEALEFSTLSLSELAGELGISSSALRRYRLQNRIPTADLARRIARALRHRAQRLNTLADQLDALTR